MSEQPVKKELTEQEKADKEAKKLADKEAQKIAKAKKEAEKQARMDARNAGAAKKQAEFVKDPNDPSASKFGDMDIIRS